MNVNLPGDIYIAIWRIFGLIDMPCVILTSRCV
jgi:hypothetical protein